MTWILGLLLLAGSASAAPATSTARAQSDPFVRQDFVLENVRQDVRKLLSGRPKIGGRPKYMNGIEFSDGTVQISSGLGFNTAYVDVVGDTMSGSLLFASGTSTTVAISPANPSIFVSSSCVDIRYFGASPNNADNSSAIQMAVNSFQKVSFTNNYITQNGGCVYIPIGRYNFSNTIDVSTAIALRGDGWGSWLNYTGATVAINFGFNGGNLLAKDFQLTGLSNGKIGMRLNHAEGTTIDHVAFSSFSQHAIYLTSPNDYPALNTRFLNNYFAGNGGNAITADGFANNTMVIENNICENNGGYCVQLTTTTGPSVSLAAASIRIVGNVMESDHKGEIYLADFQNLAVDDNYFEVTFTSAPTIELGGGDAASAGVSIRNNNFSYDDYISTAIYLHAGVSGITVAMNYFYGSATPGVYAEDGVGVFMEMNQHQTSPDKAAAGPGYFLTISTYGYIGAGTLTPTRPIDVVGIIRSTGPNTCPRCTGRGMEMYSNAGSGYLDNYDYDLALYQNVFIDGNILMQTRASNKTGIGTSSPVNKLDVSGNMAIGSYAGNTVSQTNGLNVSGIVGIGTADPRATLDVWGSLSMGSVRRSTFDALGNLFMAQGSSVSFSGSGGFITTNSSITASGFFGDGSNVTNLNASNLASGTISSARIPVLNDVNVNITTGAVISGKFGENRIAISTAATVSGKFDDRAIGISTGALISGKFGEDRIAVSTAGISSGKFDDRAVSVTTGAVSSGKFGDTRVGVSTGAISGTFGDDKVSISSAATNFANQGLNTTNKVTFSTVNVTGSYFNVGSTFVVTNASVTIRGATDGSAAVAGSVGEILSAVLGSAQAIGASDSYVALSTITLGPGRYMIFAEIVIDAGATTAETRIVGGISSVNTSFDDSSQFNYFRNDASIPVGGELAATFGPRTVTISVSTTYYLIAALRYTALGGATWGTPSQLKAIRM